MSKKKEAPGFDNGFSQLLGVTFDRAKHASRRPKNIKGEETISIKEKKVPETIIKTNKIPPEKVVEETEIVKEQPKINETISENNQVIVEKEPDIISEEKEKNIVPVKSESEIKILSNEDTENKKDFKIEDFFQEYEGEYYAQIYCIVKDRDFIRLVARFENVNINCFTDNVIQAWLNKYKGYFEDKGYLSFLEIKDHFNTNSKVIDYPFSSKFKLQERNTTMRVSAESAESLRQITTIENIAVYKIFSYSLHWWKKQYAPVLRKRKYYTFIKEFLKDVD